MKKLNFQCEVLNPDARKAFFFHCFIGAVCIPFYISSFSVLFGLVISPYLLFLLFRSKDEYFLPLVIHMMYGSQQRYIVVGGCLIYCLYHFQELSRYKLNVLFLFYMSILPFFIWYTIRRYVLFGGGIGHGGTFNGLGYYLAFAPFFYAIIMRLRITRETLYGSLYLFVGYFILRRTGLLYFSRYTVWALNLMPILLFWSILVGVRKVGVQLILISFLGSCFFFLSFIGVGEYLSFTQFGVSVIGCFLLFLGKRAKTITRFFSPFFLFVLSAVATVYIIENFYNMRGRYSDGLSYSEIKIDSWDSLKEKIIRKTFDDRGPLWAATWDSIRQQFQKDPVWVEPLPIVGEIFTSSGERKELTLMAHNISLLLLQEYGLWGGAGLYLIYLQIWCLRVFRNVLVNDLTSFYAPIVSACIGHATMGGFAGQYVMNIEFSFLLYGMVGACYYHWFVVKKVCAVRIKG